MSEESKKYAAEYHTYPPALDAILAQSNRFDFAFFFIFFLVFSQKIFLISREERICFFHIDPPKKKEKN